MKLDGAFDPMAEARKQITGAIEALPSTASRQSHMRAA